MTLGKVKTSMRHKNDKFYFIKVKDFTSLKDIIKKMKRQATNLEKIVAKHILALYPKYKKYSSTQWSKGKDNKKGRVGGS